MLHTDANGSVGFPTRMVDHSFASVLSEQSAGDSDENVQREFW